MRVSIFIILLSLALSVTACSYDSKDSAQGTAPSPAAAKQETIAPIPTAMDTFRALAPPEGLRFTPLFNEKVSNTDARLKRLEDAVQTIRNDVDTLVPTMVRMVAIEKDIKGLVAQLQTLTDQNGQPLQPSAQPPAQTPAQGEQQPAAPQQQEQAPQAPAQPAPAVAPAQPVPAPAAQPQQGQNKIPGEDVAKGTEPAKALPAAAGPDASSSLVTPEAASEGELPPDGAASPHSKAPAALKPQALNLQPAGLKAAGTASAAGATANDLRIADHSDMTRLVLDMTPDAASAAGAVRLENDGKTLVFDLTKITWAGKTNWAAKNAKLVAGYHMDEGNLRVDLLHAARIKKQMLLPPGNGNANYRLMIDLFSPEVHK